MIKNNITLTRENYINYGWPGGKPDPWEAEHEMQLPTGMQLDENGDDPTARQSPATAQPPKQRL